MTEVLDARNIEHEIDQRIRKWWHYGLVGDPQEPGYGDEMPAGYGASGIEAQYRSPQIWHAPEPRFVATRRDYDMVEPIYRARCERDRKTIAYYAGHPSKPIAPRNQGVWEKFREDVGNA